MFLPKLIAIRLLGTLSKASLGRARSSRDYKQLPKCLATLLALLITQGSTAIGGEATAPPERAIDKTVIEKKPEPNPLCFLDGKVCFDIQERFRFEARNNTFDFNDAVDALNDDNFVLNRFRLGVAIKPVEWLKIYSQGQDTR
jgi:hypothetical protein